MRAAVIINPVAGVRLPGNSARRRVALARRMLERHAFEGAVFATERAGHARELARQAVADRCDLVVAWGGDGTVNEVACALIHGEATLGVVPAGSGNGLAHGLKLPAHPKAALEKALTGSARSIDVGEFGGHLFFNVAGVGFDAAVAATFNQQGHVRGLLAYVQTVAPRFLSYLAVPCRIEADGDLITGSVLMVTVANFREFGGHAVIAPRAQPDDGLLDVVVIPDRSPVDRLSLVPHLFAGTLDRVAGLVMRRAATVRLAFDRPQAYHVDGEPHEGGPVIDARILPGALTVRC